MEEGSHDRVSQIKQYLEKNSKVKDNLKSTLEEKEQ